MNTTPQGPKAWEPLIALICSLTCPNGSFKDVCYVFKVIISAKNP